MIYSSFDPLTRNQRLKKPASKDKDHRGQELEVLRENLCTALNAHKDIGAVILKMTNDHVVRNLLALGVERIPGWRLTSSPRR
jgi:hypothetical protein